MGRGITGTVHFHGSPPRWWAYVTCPLDPALIKPGGKKTKREWIDLERPDLKDTEEDKETARNIAKQIAKDAKSGKHHGSDEAAQVAVSGAKLEDFHDRWIASLKETSLAVQTIETYESTWDGTIGPQLGAKRIADLLSPVVMKEWICAYKKTRAAATVHAKRNALSRFFNDAIEHEWIQGANPMEHPLVRKALPPIEATDEEDIVNFTQAQVETLLASKLDDFTFGLYVFSLFVGNRDGEAFGAQWGDIRTKDEIRYVHILRQVLENPPVRFGPPKKNSKRKVPIHPSLGVWLDWWHAEGWRAYVGRDPEPEDTIFPSPEGKPWRRPRSAEKLRGDLHRANLPIVFVQADGEGVNFVMHSFRHTFSTLLHEAAAAGVAGETVDQLLGHKRKSDRLKHYQGERLGPRTHAISTLKIALPVRPGVPPANAISSANVQRPRNHAKPLESHSMN